jgi:hypothetical protein
MLNKSSNRDDFEERQKPEDRDFIHRMDLRRLDGLPDKTNDSRAIIALSR